MAFNNSTNATWTLPFNFNHLKYSYYAMYVFLIIVGVTVNLWLLGGMLTSPEMRSNMRNKLVCVMCFNNLIGAGLISLFEIIEVSLIFETATRAHCSFGSFLRVMRFTLMWVENWYVLIFFVHYISTQLEFNPVKYLSPRKLQIGTILILVGPWAISFIVAPAVLVSHFHIRYGANFNGCVTYTMESFKVLANFCIMTPYFLDLGLTILLLFLNYRRKTRYSSMNSSLIGANTHIDDVKPYLVLSAFFVFTQVLIVAARLGKVYRGKDILFRIVYSFSTWYLSEARCVFMPIAFCFFEDIRTRIKTWRPWYRPAPGIDLTVQYNETKDDKIN